MRRWSHFGWKQRQPPAHDGSSSEGSDTSNQLNRPTTMKAFVTALAILAGGTAAMVSVPALHAQVNQLDAEINIIPDKSVKTENGIRISVCLVGIPHTSQRIDSVDLIVSGKTIKANDIDGVDFERYFQFEDEGVQMVDIDFPFQGTLPKTAQLIFHTAKGDITAPARQ